MSEFGDYFGKALTEQMASITYGFDGPMGSMYFGGTTTMNRETSETEKLAQAVRDLASKEPGVDLKKVADAVETANKEHIDRIDRALAAIADLEKLKKPKGQRFIVAYWHNNASHMAEGVEYPRIAGEDTECYLVYVDDRGHDILDHGYESMGALRKDLADHGASQCIVYLDK